MVMPQTMLLSNGFISKKSGEALNCANPLSQHATHASADTAVLRVTLPNCFFKDHWKSAKSKPANILASIFKENKHHHALITYIG